MKLRKRITAMALGILGCAGVLTTAAFAETGTPEKSVVEADADGTAESGADETLQAGDSDEKTVIDMHDGKLTVKTFENKDDGGKAIDGVNIRIYRIASIDESGEYTVTEDFKDAGIGAISDLDLSKSDANASARSAIRNYLEGGSVKPADSGETKDGTVAFDIPADSLGIYYIEGDVIEGYFEGEVDGKKGKLSYIPGSALVSIPSPPNEELKTDYWDYIPTVNIKYTKGGVWIDPPVLKVLKETADPVGQGRDFTFVMQGVDGAPLPNPDEYGWELAENGTVMKMTYPAAKQRILDKNDAVKQEGESQEFGVVWFTQPGLYEYLIYEMEETVTDYTFDKAQYHVYADVILQDDGTLGGNQWYEKIENGEVVEESGEYPLGPGQETPFVITNTYTHEDDTPGDKTYFDPSVKKFVKVTDKVIEGELTFKFILEAEEGTPMPGGSTVAGGKLKKEATIKVSQKTASVGLTADFGGITFEKPGTWKYRIYEDTTVPAPHTTFDTTVYEIEVTSDGKDVHGMYTDSKTGEGFDWDGKDIEFVFNNTYTRKGGGGGGGGGRRGGGSTPTPTTTTIPETEPEVIPGMLPKTGMLWWPVPVLAVAGFFLLAAGFILERRRR